MFPGVPPAVDRPAPGTSLDRAAEVMRAAKQIVDWVRSTTIMEDLGFPSKVSVDLDNSREFTLTSGYGSKNKCRARPKGADQCRGDAPKFACVDEIAFCEQQWYLRFLMPLQAVDTRRFIYATTPPLAGSWFADTVDLIKKQNEDNDYHFEPVAAPPAPPLRPAAVADPHRRAQVHAAHAGVRRVQRGRCRLRVRAPAALHSRVEVAVQDDGAAEAGAGL